MNEIEARCQNQWRWAFSVGFLCGSQSSVMSLARVERLHCLAKLRRCCNSAWLLFEALPGVWWRFYWCFWAPKKFKAKQIKLFNISQHHGVYLMSGYRCPWDDRCRTDKPQSVFWLFPRGKRISRCNAWAVCCFLRGGVGVNGTAVALWASQGRRDTDGMRCCLDWQAVLVHSRNPEIAYQGTVLWEATRVEEENIEGILFLMWLLGVRDFLFV